MHAKRAQCISRCANGTVEHLANDVVGPCLIEAVDVISIERARYDVQSWIFAACMLDDFDGTFGIVDGHDQQLRVCKTSGMKQVRPASVPEERADAEFAQSLHHVGLIVEDDGPVAVGKKHAVDDLPEASKT